MTKLDSQQMKGIAILMMLFLHLFGESWKIGSYQSLWTFGNTTIENYLCTAFAPVAFFLILSGYGLHYVYTKGNDKHRFSRIVKVYTHYIFITFSFVILNIFIGGGDLSHILGNIIGYNPTWNPHAWFLLPFSVLSLLSYWIFKWTDKISPLRLFCGAITWNLLTSYVVSRFGTEYLYPNRFLYNVFLPFHLVSSMILGSLIHRCALVAKTKSYFPKGLLSQLFGYVLIIVMIIAVSLIHPLGALYSISFTVLFSALRKPLIVSKTLATLGEQSMNMWFIHGWLCCVLFRDLFFRLHYSLLIFLATVVTSLLASWFANWCLNPIDKCMGKLLKNMKI